VGFRTGGLATVRVALPESEYEDPARVVAFQRHLIERVEALPGVQSAGVAETLPLTVPIGRISLQIEGQTVDTIGEAPVAQIQRCSPGYLEAMGIRLEAGRLLAATDTENHPLVGVVNETFAKQLLHGHALGKKVRMFAHGSPMIQIVGVVADVLADGATSTPWPRLYVHYAQAARSAYWTPSDVTLVAHTASDPAGLAAPIRAAARDLEPAVAVWDFATMQEVRRSSLSAEELPTVLLTLFGAIALLLAAIGIHGILSYAVGRRTHEIGVRMALGARASDVRRAVVLQALTPAALGLILGVTAAMYTTELLKSLLYGVSPLDPATFLAVAVILGTVALLASLLPARRATRVDPIEALRSE